MSSKTAQSQKKKDVLRAAVTARDRSLNFPEGVFLIRYMEGKNQEARYQTGDRNCHEETETHGSRKLFEDVVTPSPSNWPIERLRHHITSYIYIYDFHHSFISKFKINL